MIPQGRNVRHGQNAGIYHRFSGAAPVFRPHHEGARSVYPGLLDPTEEDLIASADQFAGDYRRLLGTAADRIVPSRETAALTEKFRDFKRAGVEGIEGCRIRSLILPLLADHVLREANHYLRLLGE